MVSVIQKVMMSTVMLQKDMFPPVLIAMILMLKSMLEIMNIVMESIIIVMDKSMRESVSIIMPILMRMAMVIQNSLKYYVK